MYKLCMQCGQFNLKTKICKLKDVTITNHMIAKRCQDYNQTTMFESASRGLLDSLKYWIRYQLT